MSQNAVANLGWTDIEPVHPVYIGDTLHAEFIGTGMRDSINRPGCPLDDDQCRSVEGRRSAQ